MADWASKLVDLPADVSWQEIDKLTMASDGRFPPPLATIRKAIVAQIQRTNSAVARLDEPRLTPEQIRHNLAKIKTLVDGLARQHGI